jgi:hypothetical protein
MTRGSTKIFGYGALAMATAVIASGSVPGCTQKNDRVAESGVSVVQGASSPDSMNGVAEPGVSVAQGESPPDCELGPNIVEELNQQMGATVGWITIETFQPHTEPKLCFNPATTKPPTPVKLTDNIGGDGSTLDLLDLDNTGVRYRLDGVVQKRSCRGAGVDLKCVLLEQKS